jgi:hypothetical protein
VFGKKKSECTLKRNDISGSELEKKREWKAYEILTTEFNNKKMKQQQPLTQRNSTTFRYINKHSLHFISFSLFFSIIITVFMLCYEHIYINGSEVRIKRKALLYLYAIIIKTHYEKRK